MTIMKHFSEGISIYTYDLRVLTDGQRVPLRSEFTGLISIDANKKVAECELLIRETPLCYSSASDKQTHELILSIIIK